MVVQVTDRLPGFGPAAYAMPGLASQTQSWNKRALAQILWRRKRGRPESSPGVADEPQADIGAQAERRAQLRPYLPIGKQVAPAAGVDRIEPAGCAKAGIGGAQVAPRASRVARNYGIRGMARQIE